jgi:hypothetical protein
MAVCFGTLALLFVLFVVVEHVRGRWALNDYLNRLQGKGEVLGVAWLEPRHPPENENAFTALVGLTNKFGAILNKLAAGPPPLRFAAPGKAIVSWRLNQWSGDDKTTHDWQKLASQMNKARELLGSVHAALQKPAFDSGFDFSQGFLVFQIGPLSVTKHVAQLLNAATLYELKNGHLAAANQHLCDLVKLTALQHPEPLVVCQLTRQACAGLAFADTWQALQARGWNDAQLKALQSAWEGCDFAGDLDGAMEMERDLTLDYYEQLKNSWPNLTLAADQREYASAVYGGAFPTLPVQGFMFHRIYLPFWRLVWADRDELRAVQRWQPLIERGRTARTNSWAAIAGQPAAGNEITPWKQMRLYDRLRFLFSSEPFSVSDSVIRQALCAQVQQQMAITAIAIHRYHLRTGIFPPNLSVLVPKYLPALPRDSMNGKALRYQLDPGAGFVLYSVGEDGKDDGGNPACNPDKKKYERIWDGRDAVWPTPAAEF